MISTLRPIIVEDIRDLGYVLSAYSILIPGPLDRPDQPSEGFYTLFQDQLHSGIRSLIRPFYPSLARFLGVLLNQLHPNSFRIMILAFVPFKMNNILINHLTLHYFFFFHFNDSAFSLIALVNIRFFDDIPY